MPLLTLVSLSMAIYLHIKIYSMIKYNHVKHIEIRLCFVLRLIVPLTCCWSVQLYGISATISHKIIQITGQIYTIQNKNTYTYVFLKTMRTLFIPLNDVISLAKRRSSETNIRGPYTILSQSEVNFRFSTVKRESMCVLNSWICCFNCAFFLHCFVTTKWTIENFSVWKYGKQKEHHENPFYMFTSCKFMQTKCFNNNNEKKNEK